MTGQLQQLGGGTAAVPPKSDAGRRVIALDKTTITALREHRLRQQAERVAAGTRWTQTGYVFTTKTGKPFGPDRMTRLFRTLVAASGLPLVTLHGLRRGAATLALAAGTDLKVVQDQLGHSTIVLTADTYTNSQELHQADEEHAGQQVTALPEQRSTRPDASPVTWEGPAAIPSDARFAHQKACV